MAQCYALKQPSVGGVPRRPRPRPKVDHNRCAGAIDDLGRKQALMALSAPGTASHRTVGIQLTVSPCRHTMGTLSAVEKSSL